MLNFTPTQVASDLSLDDAMSFIADQKDKAKYRLMTESGGNTYCVVEKVSFIKAIIAWICRITLAYENPYNIQMINADVRGWIMDKGLQYTETIETLKHTMPQITAFTPLKQDNELKYFGH